MAIENLTTYTETDPNNRFSVTSTRNTITGLTRNEDAYLYSDKGVNHFDGDFEHKLNIKITADVNIAYGNMWVLANLIDDDKGIRDASGDLLGISTAFGGGTRMLRILEIVGGTVYSDPYIYSLNTDYYLTIDRNESVGNGTLTLKIYSDSLRTTLLDTLSLALHVKIDFRYIYAGQSYNDGLTPAISGFVENLDLQGAISNGFPFFFDPGHY